MSEGPTSVGSIKGKVDIDIAEALAKLAEVKAAASNLGGRDAKIRVDTKEAVREVDNLERSTKRTGDGFKKAAENAADFRAVGVQGLVAVASAAPPVAAAAVGIAGALGGMGVAGGLALAGIVRGMKDGTGEGAKYAGMVKTLQGTVHSLQDTAARGLLPGAEKSVARLQDALPFLNSGVMHFSQQLGRIAPVGLDAVLNLLEGATPLFNASGDYIERMVQGLDDFSKSDTFKDFISYAIQNLPNVERFLGQVVDLAGDFLAAWGPVGAAALPVLTDLLGALDGIIKVTGPLVPAVIAVGFAFKFVTGLAGAINGVTGAMRLLGLTSATTAGEVALVGAAGEKAGAAGLLGKVGGLKGILGKAGLVAGGAALVGMADGYKDTTTRSLGGIAGGALAGSAFGPIGAGVGATIGSIYENRNNPGGGKTAGSNTVTYGASWNGYSGAAPQKSSGSSPMMGGSTSYNGYGAEAAKASTTANKAHADSSKVDAAAMRQQAAAAAETARQNGILSGSTNVAASAAFTGAQSADAAEAANNAWKASLKQNGPILKGNTDAALANRAALQQSVAAINTHAQAINSDGKHAAEAKVYTDRHVLALKDEAKAAGLSGGQVDAYVAKLLGVPKSVVSKITADSVKAEQAAIRAKKYADDYAKGDFNAILKGDFTPAQKAAATAAKAAKDYMAGDYKAALKADPSLANTNISQVRKNAVQFGGLKPTASLRASNDTGPGVRAAQGAINGVKGKTVTITSIYNAVYRSTGNPQIAKNAAMFGGPAAGGTIGKTNFPMGAFRGMAGGGSVGGSVVGPGTASSDTAGLYRLANGEEVVSNMFGQADRWRPLLKAINSNKLDGRFLDKMMGAAKPQITVRTVQPEIHIHNPVAVDPVAQAAEAAQLALAAAGIG